jgi:glycosyltransferase involved in cell wall biosynthesis
MRRRHGIVLVDFRERYFTGVVRLLAERGADVRHVSITRDKLLSRSSLSPPTIRALQELLALPRALAVVAAAGSDGLTVAASSHLAILAAAQLCGWLGAPRRVYLINFSLHGASRSARVRRALSFLLSAADGMLVQSPSERAFYSAITSACRIDYRPFGQDPAPVGGSLGEHAAIAESPYVFTGGYTNRDYETVVETARILKDVRFVIACSHHSHLPDELPDNVLVFRDTDRPLFHALMSASAVVVVPLLEDVGSSGQMVALAALSMGRPVVYTDFSVVGQYFEPERTGLAVPPRDPEALAAAVSRLLTDSAVAQEIGSRGAESYLQRFTGDRFYCGMADDIVAFADRRDVPDPDRGAS